MDTHETALVTGASAGIGRALAKIFAENDYDVVLTARSEDKLRALANELRESYDVEATVIPLDLSESGAANILFDKVKHKGIAIDVLVNNAGVASSDAFLDTEVETIERLVNLNVGALALLTRLFGAQMVERGHGRILNVASIFSFFPTPYTAAYGASKAFVLSLTEAMSQELKGTGVTVTALCPGYTDTDMVKGALAANEQGSIENLIPSFLKMDPEECAREGFKACMKGKTVHMDRLSNEFAAQWARFQPRWVVRNVTGIMSRFIQH